jgi:hypothetical protein
VQLLGTEIFKSISSQAVKWLLSFITENVWEVHSGILKHYQKPEEEFASSNLHQKKKVSKINELQNFAFTNVTWVSNPSRVFQ